MTTLRATRRIQADPTSTALLLAGPTAVDLWPGSRRLGEADGSIVVEAEVPAGQTQVQVRAFPPRRTPVAFVVRFATAGAEVPALSGTLTLRYDTRQATRAELALEVAGDEALSDFLTTAAEGFLANLAAAAELRADAA